MDIREIKFRVNVKVTLKIHRTLLYPIKMRVVLTIYCVDDPGGHSLCYIDEFLVIKAPALFHDIK